MVSLPAHVATKPVEDECPLNKYTKLSLVLIIFSLNLSFSNVVLQQF